MVALFLTIDFLFLNKNKLNLNQYLTLLKIQHDEESKSFPYVVDSQSELDLVERGLIQYDSGKYVLSNKGRELFGGDSLFEEFYKIFPHKVPNGSGGFRPVSTLDIEGVSAKTTRGIWDKMTKNKPHLQEKIIANLKKELEYRKQSNSLMYLPNIDTWLRNASWEKWEDIPDKNINNNYTRL